MGSSRRLGRGVALAGAACVLASAAWGASTAPERWVGSWASAQQAPEPQNALPASTLRDATLRQIVHLSAGGEALRIRVSNVFGTAPLVLDDVWVGRAVSTGSAAVAPASARPVTFAGVRAVTVPAGAEYWSDPVVLATPPLGDVSVSLHIVQAPGSQTGHPGSHALSFLTGGDRAGALDVPDAQRVEHWFFLSGVDVQARPGARAVVAFGDSIADGHASTVGGNDRWPDDLARRLAATPAGAGVSVVNLGIGGNRMLEDGLGPNAMARFDRDVLGQDGARAVILLEGVNDIGVFGRNGPQPEAAHRALVDRLIAAYGQFADAAHAHGLKVIGATILPFAGSDYYHPSPETEADRQRLNAWIRTSGRFDAVVDFDAAMRDPDRPDRLRAAYDSGDHLHPSPAGYRALADAIPLEVLER